jgi:diguanylate cyclase (GGDEF)-like protein
VYTTIEQSLVSAVALIAIICGLSWAVIGSAMRMAPNAAIRFAAANLVLGAGLILVSYRGVEASYLYYHVADWLILQGLSLMLAGIYFLARSKLPSPILRFVPLVLAILITAPFPPTASTHVVRSLMFYFVGTYLTVRCYQESFRGLGGDDAMVISARIAVSWPFLLLAAAMALRVLEIVNSEILGEAGAYQQESKYFAFLTISIAVLLMTNISMAGLIIGRLVMRISMLADHDHLTGCFNRRTLEVRLQIELKRNRRTGENLACVFFDLDHFKRINDVYGHAAGDAALKHAVLVIQKLIRSVDVLGRFGGEEFLVILTDTHLSGARDAANRMRQALEDSPLEFKGQSIALTASFGAAVLNGVESLEDFVRRADAAMYEAKNLGRNRVEIALH